MHCPNCRHILTVVELDNIEVEHCNNCGGTLFEANEINRITKKDAQRLALMKQTDVISAAEKLSPRDGSVLKRIDNESIPRHVTLLKSDSTSEVFAFPDDLLEFKSAQKAKIDYYKAWRIPLLPLKAVLVYSLAMFAVLSIAYMVSFMQSPQSRSIQAESLCEGGIAKIELGDSYVISCTTQVKLTCKAVARCEDGVIEDVELTSSDFTSFGTVPKTCTAVRFVCEDGKQVVATEWDEL